MLRNPHKRFVSLTEECRWKAGRWWDTGLSPTASSAQTSSSLWLPSLPLRHIQQALLLLLLLLRALHTPGGHLRTRLLSFIITRMFSSFCQGGQEKRSNTVMDCWLTTFSILVSWTITYDDEISQKFRRSLLRVVPLLWNPCTCRLLRITYLLRRSSWSLYTREGNIFSGLQSEQEVFTGWNTLELSFNSTQLVAGSWLCWIQHLPSSVVFGSFLEGARSFQQKTLYIGFIEHQTHFGLPSRCVVMQIQTLSPSSHHSWKESFDIAN